MQKEKFLLQYNISETDLEEANNIFYRDVAELSIMVIGRMLKRINRCFCKE